MTRGEINYASLIDLVIPCINSTRYKSEKSNFKLFTIITSTKINAQSSNFETCNFTDLLEFYFACVHCCYNLLQKLCK